MSIGRARLFRWIVATTVLLGIVTIAVPSVGTALVVSKPLASPDAVVSLASHEWERLPAAAAVARNNPRTLLILTLPKPVTQLNCHDCAHRVEQLDEMGISEDRIAIAPLTLTGTYGEALATRTVVMGRHLRSVLVVTSPYHTRRSLATFRKLFDGSGIAVGVLPATATSPARPERWWAASYDRAYVRYEWAALLYYRVRHGVRFSREPARPE